MARIPVIKAKDFLDFLEQYGCDMVSIKGSHHKVHNPTTAKTSVVAVHAGKDLDKGAFSSILNQLGIDVNTFISFISG